MELLDKLNILADAAKYDAACTSSGLDRSVRPGTIGSTTLAGCCHSFSADGRCISLLKVLQTNVCVYDCQYCVNRRSNDVPRAAFTPEVQNPLGFRFKLSLCHSKSTSFFVFRAKITRIILFILYYTIHLLKNHEL